MQERTFLFPVSKVIRNRPFFFLSTLIYWIFGALSLLFFSKKEIHLFFNDYHSPFGDFIFPWLTRIGEEFLYALLILIFLFKKNYKAAIMAGISILIHTVIVQTLKNFIFADAARPKTFFGEPSPLHFVKGIEVHHFHSFPSGHTATAFAVFCLISLFHKHYSWQILAFIGALSVAFSRIYLQQHFFIDTYFGSIIGIFSALSAYIWYQKNTKLNA